MTQTVCLIRLNQHDTITLSTADIAHLAERVVFTHYVMARRPHVKKPTDYAELLQCDKINKEWVALWLLSLDDNRIKSEASLLRDLLVSEITLVAKSENSSHTLTARQAKAISRIIAMTAYLEHHPHSEPHAFNALALRDVSWADAHLHPAFVDAPKAHIIEAVINLQANIEGALAYAQRAGGALLPETFPLSPYSQFTEGSLLHVLTL